MNRAILLLSAVQKFLYFPFKRLISNRAFLIDRHQESISK